MVSISQLYKQGENLYSLTKSLMINSEIIHNPIRRDYNGIVYFTESGDYQWSFYNDSKAIEITSELETWLNFISKNDNLISISRCFNSTSYINAKIKSEWRTHSNNIEKEITNWCNHFENILSSIKSIQKYEEKESTSQHTDALNMTIYAEKVNITISQIDELIMEIDKLEKNNLIAINQELRDAIQEYRADESNRSGLHNILSKMKTGLSTTSEFAGLIESLISIVTSIPI